MRCHVSMLHNRIGRWVSKLLPVDHLSQGAPIDQNGVACNVRGGVRG